MFHMLMLIKQGGWTMLPLAACSLAGLTIIFERLLALRRPSVLDPRVIKLVEEYSEQTSPEKAVLLCQRCRGPFARLVEDILRQRHLDHEHAVEAMHMSGRAQVGALERGLTLLEIVGVISPLLGLLGTVLGMRVVFNAISAQGLGNPQVLSDGIAQALITTIAGLFIAIPAVAAHSWFTRRVDDLATEMQDRAMGLVATLQGLRRTPSH